VSGELVALLLTFLVHLAGLCVLVGALFRNGDGGWRDWWPRDDEPEGEPGGGPPLPDAEQARRRLREPGRLGDAYPRRPRRSSPDAQPSRRPSVPS
jgi:hypothetical protein